MPLDTLKAAKLDNLNRSELIKEVKRLGVKIDCRKSTDDIKMALISHNKELTNQQINKQKATDLANLLIDTELNRLSPAASLSVTVQNCLPGLMSTSSYNLIRVRGRGLAKINKLTNTQGMGFKLA
jgi:hypothetical protein